MVSAIAAVLPVAEKQATSTRLPSSGLPEAGRLEGAVVLDAALLDAAGRTEAAELAGPEAEALLLQAEAAAVRAAKAESFKKSRRFMKIRSLQIIVLRQEFVCFYDKRKALNRPILCFYCDSFR